ncbi:MAG: discoidin domain-containing protein [Phycisphaerae bacterium]|nr:discoidin domain-containing protein [Phycisphaerae bacterium]
MMMTPHRTRTVVTLAAVAMLGFMITPANAQVIYSETFDGDGTALLNGLAPTTGEGVWSANSFVWNDGTVDTDSGCAILPFVPAVNKVYTVMLDATVPHERWVAIGFKNRALASAGASSAADRFVGGAGIAWMLWRKGGDTGDPTPDIQIFAGPDTGNAMTDDNRMIGDYTLPHTLQIILDTTGDGSSFTADFWVDGASVSNGPQTISQAITQINYVGFGNAGNIGDIVIDNFLFMEGLFSREKASLPNPDDEQTDVLRDSDLGWTSGEFAATHNVYVGDSFEDVNAATVPTGSNLDVNSFDPGHLDFGQTVYWRVDEVNGTPDRTVFKGDVWSFTVEPYAVMIPVDVNHVTASSYTAANPPSMIVNGSGLAGNTHSADSGAMWLSAAGDMTPWLMFEFDTVQKLDQMLIWNSNSSSEGFIGWGLKDVNIETSVDGVDWTSLAESPQIGRAPGLATYDEPQAVDLGLALAKYVRIDIQSNWGGLLKQYGVAEIQFYGLPVYARTPDPASGSADIDPQTVLAWRAGREAGQHTVYMSTDTSAVAEGAAPSVTFNTSSAPLDSFDIQLGEAYYWRVDEVNEAETLPVWQGPVWSFSTAPYVVIDDFETYTNISPDRPFQTWIDGIGFSNPAPGNPGNGSGAAIGHDIWSPSSPYFDGSIMETGLVFGGSQSMPVYYNGAGTQVDLSLGSQDWTQYGLQTLSIAFHGTPGNTGQLYAKINTTKILYDQDPADIANGSWLVWQIDLSSVNGLDNVTQLSIGVDGAGAAGVLYLDEIGLYARAGELITPVAPGTANLVAYYRFEGDLLDAAGTHHGTINSGMPAFVSGVQGQALECIGNQDVTVAYADDLSLNSFTVSAWVNVSDIGGNRGILGTRYNGDNTFDLKVDANRIHCDVGDGTAWLNTAVDYYTQLRTDTWYHIAYVIDQAESAARIYLNGALAETIAINGVPLFMKAGQELHIGNSYGIVEYMYGTLDDVSIYQGALSSAEVASLAGRTLPIYEPF